jgi:hypothetical protein
MDGDAPGIRGEDRRTVADDVLRFNADALGDGDGAVVERVAEFTQAMVRPR